jgi:hypothetical protein
VTQTWGLSTGPHEWLPALPLRSFTLETQNSEAGSLSTGSFERLSEVPRTDTWVSCCAERRSHAP